MGSQELGECSRKTECSDTSIDNERPLKKARHVWQLKGNLQTKDGSSKDFNSNIENDSATSTIRNPNKLENKSENGKCNGRCCLEALLSQSDRILNSIDSSENNFYAERHERNEMPSSLKIDPENRDYYLRKWQQEEQAKGFMENTINKVLETFMTVSSDISDFLENHENDEQVEDEGILMAIQSHGLQPNVEDWAESNIKQSDGNFSSSKEHVKEKESREDCQNLNIYENEEVGDHSNFLDTAVSVAIQKKGLLLSQNYI